MCIVSSAIVFNPLLVFLQSKLLTFDQMTSSFFININIIIFFLISLIFKLTDRLFVYIGSHAMR